MPAEVVNQTEEMGRERGSETTPADTVMVVVCGFKAALQLNSRRERGREREGTGQQKKKHKLNSRGGGGSGGGSVTWKILCRNSWEEKEGEGEEEGNIIKS